MNLEMLYEKIIKKKNNNENFEKILNTLIIDLKSKLFNSFIENV